MFGKKEEGRVPLNNDVISKCRCDACPVQTQSACARPKIQKMMNMKGMSHMSHQAGMPGMSMSLAQEPMEKMDVNPADLPGPYCTIGVAACKDLDNSKACICPTCQVYKDYNLMQAKPVEHFCFNDKAV